MDTGCVPPWNRPTADEPVRVPVHVPPESNAAKRKRAMGELVRLSAYYPPIREPVQQLMDLDGRRDH